MDSDLLVALPGKLWFPCMLLQNSKASKHCGCISFSVSCLRNMLINSIEIGKKTKITRLKRLVCSFSVAWLRKVFSQCFKTVNKDVGVDS